MRRFASPKRGRRRSTAAILCVTVALRLAAQEPASPESAPQDDPFDSVFGARTQVDRPLPTPVFVDGKKIGTAAVFPPEGYTSARINGSDLSQLLSPEVDAETRDALAGLARDREFVGEPDLAPLGIELSFDSARLTLHVQLPGSVRPLRSISIRGRADANLSEVLQPAEFSGSLNAWLSSQIIAGGPAETFKVPVSVTVDPVVRYSGYVIESSLHVGYDDAWSFSPSYLRLMKDFSDPALRISIGDALYRAAGFQARVPLQGVAVDRAFALSPTRRYRPALDRTLILDFPSTVRVLVNGRETLEATFPAGRYALTDFALATGLNDVTIETVGPDGSIERIEFDTPFDGDLLRRGVNEFSYAVGVPPFQADVPRVSGFHRIGVTDRLTLGANVQTDFVTVSAGLDALWAFRLGVAQIDAAGSLSHGVAGGAAALRYQFRRIGRREVPSLGAALTYTGADFRTLAGSVSQNATFRTQASLSHRFAVGPAVNLVLSSIFDAQDWSATPGASLSVSGSLGLGMNLSLSLDVDYPPAKAPVWEAHVRFSSAGLDRGVSAGFSQDLKRGTTTVRAQRSPIRPTRSAAYGIGLSGIPGDPTGPLSVNGTARYTGRRFSVDFAGRASELAGTPLQVVSSVQLASALAFADRRLAVTRPIRGPFAIIDRNPKYREMEVGVNPSAKGFEAVADRLGPAVLPSLASFAVNRVYVESKQLPMGYDLGPSSYDLWPGYKSGHRITVGKPATIFATGRIVAVDGTPVVLASGRLTAEDGGEHEFFTNRDGRFSAYGLVPGTYRVTVASSVAVVEISSPGEGGVALGDILVEQE